MRRIAVIVLVSSLLALFGCGKSSDESARQERDEETWWLKKTVEDGKITLIRAREQLPPADERKGFVWLAVISWPYEAKENGMPLADVSKRMSTLEDTIDRELVQKAMCILTLCRTRDGLKEWEYYIKDRDAFTKALDKVLNGHPEYPIEISFRSDPEWESLKAVLKGGEED
jgi:hypothetical protein